MAVVSVHRLAEILAQSFPVDSADGRVRPVRNDIGYRILPITGQAVRFMALDDLVSRLKDVLPSDAAILAIDGLILRLATHMGSGYGRDSYNVIFGSSSWDPLDEGALIPVLEPIFYRHAPAPEDAAPIRIHLPVLEHGHSYELAIDKRAFSIEIPRSREDDEQCVIVIKPLK